MFGSSGANLAGSVTSTPTVIRKQDNCGILVSWTGTAPVGVITIEVSNDYDADHGVAGTWIALDFGTPIAISGATGSADISINQLPFSNIRAVYTRTSGTGTLIALLSCKSLSGGAG